MRLPQAETLTAEPFEFDREGATAHLRGLFGKAAGRYQIAWKVPGDFPHAEFDTIEQAVDCAAKLHADHSVEGIYYRMLTLVGAAQMTKRGDSTASRSMVCLWADIDYGTVGHKVREGGLPLPPDEARALSLIRGLPTPTLLIHSGGGLYPIWQFDEPVELDEANRDRFEALSIGWQRIIEATAASQGWQYGNVGDLARVLRLPGSANRKAGVERPCRTISGGSGELFTVQALEQIVTETSVDLAPAPEFANHGTGGSGVADILARTVSWSDLLVPHDWKPVAVPDSDVQEAWQRPGASSDVSAKVLKANPHSLVVWSDNAGLPVGKGQRLTKIRVWAHLNGHGDDLSSASKALLNGGGANLPPEFSKALSDRNKDTREAFWRQRPILTHIRRFALARMTSPWAVLGVCLASAIDTVPPTVVLPPLVGSDGSLNLFVSLVGSSSGGKSSSIAAGHDCLVLPLHEDGSPLWQADLGSGEGIVRAYAHIIPAKKPTKADPEGKDAEQVWDRREVQFAAPEVDTLSALGARQGATLLPQLRKCYSGESLGFTNADRERNFKIPDHSYRLTLLLGVQPERAAPLMNDADAGTPQRFIWLPVQDAAITEDVERTPPPFEVPAIDWRGLSRDARGRVQVSVPVEVAGVIRSARAAAARGETSSLDGHSLFTREKVAVALAVLDGRFGMSLDDWSLAGVVMEISTETKRSIQATLASKRTEQTTSRAKEQGHVQVVVEETKRTATIGRVTEVIESYLAKQEGRSDSRSQVRKAVARRDREFFDEAEMHLVSSGRVKQHETAGGHRLELASRRNR